MKFRERLFTDVETLAVELAEDYKRQSDITSYKDANARLLKFHETLLINDLNLTAPEGELREFSEERARECSRLQSERGRQEPALAACTVVAARYGIDPPAANRFDKLESLERLTDTRWWYQQIRKKAARVVERKARDLGTVCKLRGIYASDRAHAARARIKIKTRQFLEQTFAVNEEGLQFSLAELADKSVSNPAIRRAELMTRFRGFEEVAELRGDQALFITLTTPSRMHAVLGRGGLNAKFDGTDPRQAQLHLRQVWARIRSALDRSEIRPYGFRIAEPHHDGTPHWHFLLFAPERCHAEIVSAFERYGLESDPDEPGARNHRVEVVEIDPEKGSPAGYVAKYVAKNVDGACLDEDLHGTPAPTAAQRIEAWARLWGVRQFQQIGGPLVTVWRELRKIRTSLDGAAEPVRQAADSADWAAFVLCMGGVGIPRSQLAICRIELPEDSVNSARRSCPSTQGLRL